MTTESISSRAKELYMTHEKKIYTGSALVSLVFALISLGVFVAATATADHVAFNVAHQNNWYKEGISLEDAMLYPRYMGLVGMGCAIGGGVAFAISLVLLYRAHKKPKENSKTEVREPLFGASAEMWKNIGIIIGVSVAAFAFGLMIGSSLNLDHSVSKVEALFHQGRIDYPNAYMLNSGENFWNYYTRVWLDPTTHNMNGILTASVFGMIGGGALVAASYLGKGIFSCISYFKKDEKLGEVNDTTNL